MIKNLYEDAIAESVRGDLQAFSRLVESGMPVDASHGVTSPNHVLTKNAVLSVLRSFERRNAPESLVQQWAFLCVTDTSARQRVPADRFTSSTSLRPKTKSSRSSDAWTNSATRLTVRFQTTSRIK